MQTALIVFVSALVGFVFGYIFTGGSGKDEWDDQDIPFEDIPGFAEVPPPPAVGYYHAPVVGGGGAYANNYPVVGPEVAARIDAAATSYYQQRQQAFRVAAVEAERLGLILPQAGGDQ